MSANGSAKPSPDSSSSLSNKIYTQHLRRKLGGVLKEERTFTTKDKDVPKHLETNFVQSMTVFEPGEDGPVRKVGAPIFKVPLPSESELEPNKQVRNKRRKKYIDISSSTHSQLKPGNTNIVTMTQKQHATSQLQVSRIYPALQIKEKFVRLLDKEKIDRTSSKLNEKPRLPIFDDNVPPMCTPTVVQNHNFEKKEVETDYSSDDKYIDIWLPAAKHLRVPPSTVAPHWYES